MEERKFKVGDKVVLTTTECTLFEVGDFAEVVRVDNGSSVFSYEVSNPENSDWVKESQIKLASDPETFTGLELVTMLANGELKEDDKFKCDTYVWQADVEVSKSRENLEFIYQNGISVNWNNSMLTSHKWVKVAEKFQYKLNLSTLGQLGLKPNYEVEQYLNVTTNRLGNIEISADGRLEQVGCQTWFTDEEFEQLEDPDKVKHLFEKVIETEES